MNNKILNILIQICRSWFPFLFRRKIKNKEWKSIIQVAKFVFYFSTNQKKNQLRIWSTKMFQVLLSTDSWNQKFQKKVLIFWKNNIFLTSKQIIIPSFKCYFFWLRTQIWSKWTMIKRNCKEFGDERTFFCCNRR